MKWTARMTQREAAALLSRSASEKSVQREGVVGGGEGGEETGPLTTNHLNISTHLVSGTVSATHLHIYIPKEAQMFRGLRLDGRLCHFWDSHKRRRQTRRVIGSSYDNDGFRAAWINYPFAKILPLNASIFQHLARAFIFQCISFLKELFSMRGKKIQKLRALKKRCFENPGMDALKSLPPPFLLLLLSSLMPSLSLMSAHWLICRGAKQARCQYGCKFVSVQIF